MVLWRIEDLRAMYLRVGRLDGLDAFGLYSGCEGGGAESKVEGKRHGCCWLASSRGGSRGLDVGVWGPCRGLGPPPGFLLVAAVRRAVTHGGRDGGGEGTPRHTPAS